VLKTFNLRLTASNMLRCKLT